MDTVLRHYLALLHPVMPHITEELWVSLGFADANGGLPLMRTPLPSADGLLAGLDETRITLANTQAAALYETANKARNLKAEYDLSNNKNVSFILKPPMTSRWTSSPGCPFWQTPNPSPGTLPTPPPRERLRPSRRWESSSFPWKDSLTWKRKRNDWARSWTKLPGKSPNPPPSWAMRAL